MAGELEFECPQYVDFLNLDDQIEDKIDTWFECKSVCDDANTDAACEDADSSNNSTEAGDDTLIVSQEDEQPSKTPIQSNRRSIRIQSAYYSAGTEEAQLTRKHKTPSHSAQSTPARLFRNTPARSARNSPSSVNGSTLKNWSVAQQSAKKPRFYSSPSLTLRKKIQKQKKEMVPDKHKLTMPLTPQVLKRTLKGLTGSNRKAKTTEEKELEEMKLHKTKMAEAHRAAERAMAKAMKGSQPTKPYTMQVTVPTEFNFATDARIKSHPMELRHEPKDFVATLRKTSPCNAKSKRRSRITKPSPFTFNTEKMLLKRSTVPSTSTEKFKSAAELVEEFHRNLPSRSHKETSQTGEHKEKHITQPHTPQLLTKSRKRKASIISQEMREEQEVEQIKQYKFRANPVNEKIMKFPIGIKKIEKAPATKIKPFEFESDKLPPKKKPEVVEEKFEFRAQPVPTKAFAGPSVASSMKKCALTMPQSPAFCLKERVMNRSRRAVPKQDTPKPIRANPIPHQGIPFFPKLDKKTTTLKPFTFDERDKKMLAKKDDKIKEEIELATQLPKFKAQLLPPATPNGIPKKKVKPATNPAPFNLLIDARGVEQAEKWQKQVEEELKQQKKQREFKARTCSVPYNKPFTVKPSHRALTNISSFELNTDRRAKHWEVVEMEKKSKQIEIEAILRERQMEQEKAERLAIAKLRRETVHQPQPILKCKPLVIKPSHLELTEPRSPRFSERLRSSRT